MDRLIVIFPSFAYKISHLTVFSRFSSYHGSAIGDKDAITVEQLKFIVKDITMANNTQIKLWKFLKVAIKSTVWSIRLSSVKLGQLA